MDSFSDPWLGEEGVGVVGFGCEAPVHLGQCAVAQTRAARREVVASSDGEIAKGGHDLSGRSFLELGAIFVVGAVTAVVDGVFDSPVGA